MSNNNGRSAFFTDLRRELGELRQAIGDGWNNFTVATRNQLRMLRDVKLDYVFMPVGGPLPERSAPPRSFIERQLPLPSPPLSMETLNHRLQAVADASNVKGVVFVFRGFSTGLATLQNFRQSVQRLRATGKETIVFTPYLDTAHYYAASAADHIVIPPITQFEVLGLHTEAVFLKDALNQIGVEADIVQISPYKTAGNMLDHADMTPEQRQQLDWLLDERYHILTAGMAEGRHKSQEEMKQLIDRAPLFAEDALSAGLVDHLAYEDELAHLLAEAKADEEKGKEEAKEETAAAEPEESETEETAVANPGPTAAAAEETDSNEQTPKEEERPKARLLAWDKAYPLLMEKARRRHRKFIGVVSLEGAIAMGPSRQPPIDLPIPLIGGAVAGEQTLVRLLRRAEQMDDMAALIFHVDSGGGSAVASDLIGRQVKRISRQKPVLVYMGDVAASGGYYVSAPARYIMSQSGTTTGSIGVIMGRLSTRGLYQKIRVNRVSLKRGQHADLYSDEAPMTEEERQIFWDGVVDVYQKFKQVVAEGRDLPLGELDPVSEGRVWSGRQALERNLVDGHGDFVGAVRKVAELAGLPTDDEHVIPVVNLYPKRDSYLPPRPFEANEAVTEIGRLLAGERWRELNGRPLLLMPFELRFR